MNITRDNRADWGIVGHQWAVDFLRQGLLHGRHRHAYLITGSQSLGKMKLALTFAMALNCAEEDVAARPCGNCRACKSIERGNDPDLIVAGSEDGAGMKIGAIREVTRRLALKPYAARYRIAIFDDFDLVAPQAQDALLKTLEEPAPYAIMILLASEGERLLPTIRSRAQTIQLRPAPLQLVKAELINRGCADEHADLIARLSGGRMGWALAAMQDDEVLDFRREKLDLLKDIVAGTALSRLKAAERTSKEIGRDKAELREILEIWRTFWRDVLLQCYDSPVKPCNSDRMEEVRALAQRITAISAREALVATERTMLALDTNANIRLALDVLFLEYPGI